MAYCYISIWHNLEKDWEIEVISLAVPNHRHCGFQTGWPIYQCGKPEATWETLYTQKHGFLQKRFFWKLTMSNISGNTCVGENKILQGASTATQWF